MSSGKSQTLKKGQACICCRRRKTRCDGARPICGQCASNGRELDCEYSDGFSPTRTEILQEYLSRLQNRVQSLEAYHGHRTVAGVRQTRLSIRPSSGWWTSELPPPQIARALFETFLEHEHQVGWALNSDRMMAAISSGPSSPSFPHPALVNAVFLWGSHFSSGSLSGDEIEEALFTRAVAQLQNQQLATRTLQHGLQAIQAEVLLATYLFVLGGRSLETDYHVSAAVRLALGFGMNRIVPHSGADPIEEGERISVFWKVFCLDMSWAITTGKPATMKLEGSSRVIVTTPWPKAAEEYAQGSSSRHPSSPTQPLQQFLEEGGNATSGFSHPALTVKAALLCERSSHYASRPTSDAEIRFADSTIFSFVRTLAPLDGNASIALKVRFIYIHATAYLAFIRLHEVNATRDAGAYMRCVQAARYISMLPGYTRPDEFVQLDPFTMPCLVISSKVLMREITRVRQLQPGTAGSEVIPPNVLRDELNRMMNCLEELVALYPVIESQLDSLRDMRESMHI